MLHPALAQALATAHIEDLHRAAARRRAIRLARRVAHEPPVAATSIAMLRSASTRLRWTPRASGRRHDTTELPQAEGSGCSMT
jgi:proline dehydrogenase